MKTEEENQMMRLLDKFGKENTFESMRERERLESINAELLEACEEFSLHFEECRWVEYNENSKYCEEHSFIDRCPYGMARKAIAKAKGENEQTIQNS